MAPNQPLPQQVQHPSAKPVQSGVNQLSPSHNQLARQHGVIHQSQLHSGSQGSLVPAAPHFGIDANQVSATGSDFKSAVLEKPADSMLDNASQVKQSEAELAVGNAFGPATSRSSEVVISKPDCDSKSMAEGETPIDVNENSETKVNKDDLMLKHLRGAAADFQDGAEDSNVCKTIEGAKEDHRSEGKQSTKPKAMIEGITADSTLDGPNAVQPLPGNNKQMEKSDQGSDTRSQTTGNAASSIQTAQPGPFVQQHNDVETHEKAFPPSGYYDKGLSQFPPPQAGAVGLRGISPVGPLLVRERYPPQNIPYGHPPNMDVAIVSQRPSGPDGMFPQSMHQPAPSQERRVQEPFPHSIPVHGPPTAPGQLRPPGYSENFPYPGQTPAMVEPFQPPPAKQPYSSNILPTNAEEINPYPVRSQSHGAPLNAIGPGPAQIDPLARSVMAGPPPRPFDAARGSHFGYEDRAGQSGPVNLMEGPGYYDGRQSESHRPLHSEHVPFGQQAFIQPNMMKMNGLSGKGSTGVMHDSAFSHGVPDDRFQPPTGERFKPLPEDGLRAAPGENFRPMMDSGWNIANHREYEEDLKQFPRPSHLDGDGSHRFNMYGPASRPVERGQHFGPDGGPRSFDRASMGSFPPHPSSGRFPSSSGGLEFGPPEIADRQRGPAFHDELGGKHETLPERLRPFPEFGRPHIDSLPSRRSPGKDFSLHIYGHN